MPDPDPGTVTRLLHAAASGEAGAADHLWSIVHTELRKTARAKMAGEAPGVTLQTTALIDEAYIKLVGAEGRALAWDDRRHFYGAAAKAMEQVLVDEARRRGRLKRGGGGGGPHDGGGEGGGHDPGAEGKAWHRIPLDHADRILGRDSAEILAISEALDRLEHRDERKADIVRLRYFADLTVAETARLLGISEGTVKNEWRFARAWLHRELSKGGTSAGTA